MQHRVGALHVRYQVRDGSADSLTPTMQRALAAGLAEALEARLAATYGQDESVIVVRELHGRVTLAGTDLLLDRRIVDRVCAASLQALDQTLANADSHSLMRFADEVEFVGSFIVELLAGSAWQRWYFGAFARHRHESLAGTLRAVLADCGHGPRVFAWLRRHGKLSAVLALLEPGPLLTLAGVAPRARTEVDAGSGIELLADVARDIAAALGIEAGLLSREELVRRYWSSHSAAPAWLDRRPLSMVVLALLWECVEATPAWVPRPADMNNAQALLDGKYDWLDVTWLQARLPELADSRPPATHTRANAHSFLGARQAGTIGRLVLRIRSGEWPLEAIASIDACVIELLALLADDLPDAQVDALLLDALRDIAACFVQGAELPAALREVVAEAEAQTATLPGRSLHAVQPAAEIRDTTDPGPTTPKPSPRKATHRSRGESRYFATDAGGLFLMIRALLDLRLPTLATCHAIPLAPLLSALAVKWFDVRTPFDAATALWTGASTADFAALESCVEPLGALNEELAAILESRFGPDAALRAAVELDAPLLAVLPCSAELDAGISRTACLMLRAWAYWLRGVAHSSARFLLEQCLRRHARAHVDDEIVSLQIGPAPLDVVLRMAGYFERIESVPWLNSRRVLFSLVPTLREDS